MKNTATAKEVVPVSAGKPAILITPTGQLKSSLSVNLGAGGLSAFDLTRLRVAPGGTNEFISETFEGERREKTVEGIITVVRDVRSYWEKAYGQGEPSPPDCQSPDGVHGYGDPGGVCARCPKNVFGSKGRGKACSEMKQLFIHRGSSLLPEVLQLPPTSVAVCKRYLLWLAGQQAPYYSVITQVSLTQASNANGIKYSEARFKKIADLSEEETQRMNGVHNDFREYVERMPVTAGYESEDNP